ncbi:NADH-quinone oxidoreductase subunit M [Chloracidobacterium validum]|uniref:NADH-quinone oxidoreductase subunit M n=1 Tax=Chloracidobacterium validum TaxID=2821543 RepID=A0ABX8BCI2_9BACT|nr:NADH-quinone oxidoreductase subunit M [Chloracidobacterium validum]QUW03358.1 NADH-quinone oxidoreductase subunit M [Chloracidobacterium validum]
MTFLDTGLLLILLVVLPIAGALAIIGVSAASIEFGRRHALTVALVAALMTFGLALRLISQHANPALVVDAPWIPILGVNFHLAIDGLSLWLVLLVALLTPLAMLVSTSITARRQVYFLLILVLESGLIGVFLARDLVTFYVFWEIVLIPAYFLIGIWGGEGRLAAVTKFFLYTVVGSLLMLSAIIGLYVAHGEATGRYTFDLDALVAARNLLPMELRTWCFWGFAVAFFVKIPLFPFHTWQADTYAECPTPVTALLSGAMSKMGTYALVRFGMGLFPDIAREWALPILALAVVSILHGALVAIVQTDLKRLLAYSSLSHLGFVTLGVFSFTVYGVEGAVFHMAAHGVTTGALFLLVAMLETRRRTTALDGFGGLASTMPRFAFLMVVASLASAGVPFTNGFIGEFLTLLGAFTSVAGPWFAVAAAAGMVLSAVYLLTAIRETLFGPHQSVFESPDMDWREIAAVVPLVVLMLVMGIAPGFFLGPTRPAIPSAAVAARNPAGPSPSAP